MHKMNSPQENVEKWKAAQNDVFKTMGPERWSCSFADACSAASASATE